MGAYHLKLESYINTLLDVVVIKTGIVISEEYLINFLKKEFSEYDYFKNYNELKFSIQRIRSECFDEFCIALRINLGELDNNPAQLIFSNINRDMEWFNKGYDPTKVISKIMRSMEENYDVKNPRSIDPIPIINKLITEKYAPIQLIKESLEAILNMQKMSNVVTPVEQINWDGGTKLDDFFDKELIPRKNNTFIEQKIINYFEANPEKLEYMHWRNFERLTAEFFNREGYNVTLGPGTNDEGIDVRVFDKLNSKKPYIIIQCKRHKSSNQVKIETVKSFYTDIEFEGATKGLIATTSKVAKGGKKVVSVRKYPLSFAENKEIVKWVKTIKKR